jgi:hypothetical protein
MSQATSDVKDKIDKMLKKIKRLYIIHNAFYIVMTLLGIILAASIPVLSVDSLKDNYPAFLPALLGGFSAAFQSILITFRFHEKAQAFSKVKGNFNTLLASIENGSMNDNVKIDKDYNDLAQIVRDIQNR